MTLPPASQWHFDNEDLFAKENRPKPINPIKSTEIFDSQHYSTVGYWGAIETWRRNNKFAPGHGMSQKEVAELVLTCANCEKNRLEKVDKLVPIVRSLKPPHLRSAIGIDAVKITPHGKAGHSHIYVLCRQLVKTIWFHGPS